MSIVIGSYTLTNPSDESIEYEVLGASYMLANGHIQHDNIQALSLQIITLSWKAVSESVLSNIRLAYESLFTADRLYTDIRGDDYTVTVSQGRDKLSATTVNRSTPLYNVTIKLREVL